jgi:catechol 2,3-dioxygenase-like lactoylglutathione lyase family enzyme
MKKARPIYFECVDHINMFVRDLEESIDFYQNVFGTDAEVKQRGKAKGIRWCIIGIPSKMYFCLYELKGKIFDPSALHINHIGFYVPDFDETVKRIKALGIEIQYEGRPVEWKNKNGKTRSLYIKDPNEYYIEFTEKLGGGLG